jgi:DNA-binding NarL/FixJ family response regulator
MVRKDYNRDGAIYYPDKGCTKAKAAGYLGTCLPSEEYPEGCPFPQCLEDPGVPSPLQEENTKRNTEIKHLSETGWTADKIAKYAGLSERHTQRIISGDAETGNRPYKRHRKRKDLAQRNEEIRKLKEQGVPVDEIAGKYGICTATVWAVCRGC